MQRKIKEILIVWFIAVLLTLIVIQGNKLNKIRVNTLNNQGFEVILPLDTIHCDKHKCLIRDSNNKYFILFNDSS
jgi:hypothetical protein